MILTFQPQNIFLQADFTGSYIVKIGDFGLATLVGAKQCAHSADTNTLYVGELIVCTT